jgi:outer membrane protein OmpA-like peptidoglycan-associated protein
VNGNYDAGGYGAIYGDVQFNLSNLFCGYNETRVWNVIVYPRAGVIRNFERNNYYPVLGAGFENTWRINKLLSIYVDAAYNWVTNAHINNPAIPEKRNGLSNNGYVDLNLGLQFNLGKSTFSKAVTIDQYNALAAASEEAIAKLRADLDRERQINADLRAQLAKAPKGNTVVSNNVVAGATSVFFDINSSKINSQKDLINLESIATSAKNSKAKVVVTGAADSKTGSDAYNPKLSEARAQAVADELVNLGVSRDNIEVKSVGGVNDVTPYNLNRRAIIELK